MKKIFILFLLIAFTLTGCSLLGTKDKTPPPKTGTDQAEPKKEDYFIGLETPVAGVKDWVYRYRQYEGVFLQKQGDYRLALVSMGEKFSSGYVVRIDRVTRKDDKWVVETTLTTPGEENYAGASVYPNEVVSIKADGKPVEVLKTGPNGPVALEIIEIPEGQKLGTSKNFVVFTPVEGDKITSPVLIKGKARVFEANFQIGIEDGHYQLAKKILMADEGAPGWGDFEVRLPFTKPTNPSGAIIFSYANMANGEMIEELVLPVKF